MYSSFMFTLATLNITLISTVANEKNNEKSSVEVTKAVNYK